MNFYFALMIFICSISVIFVNSQTCAWGTWGEWATCSDTCGNCGTQLRTRTCTTTNTTCTTCTGNATDSQVCAPAICIYPRASCCSGSPASVSGLFECA